MAVRKHLADLDLSKNQLLNAVLQNLTSAPSSPTEGQMYYNTTSHQPYIRLNNSWLPFGGTATGDMSKSTYDPQNIQGDAFARANHTGTQTADTITDGTTNKAYTAVEKTKLAGVSTGADVTGPGNVGNAIHNATAKTSPVNADEIPVIDSAASNVLKKITYQNLSSAIAAILIDSAPTTLDTLKELATALGNDPNYAATITTALATKLAKDQNLADVVSAVTAFNNIKQAATTSYVGASELATEAETIARSDATRTVTPAGLASFPRKYAANVGDGTATSFAVAHNLGSSDVTVQLREVATGAIVDCDMTVTDANTVTLAFNTPPASAAYRVVVVG